MAQVRKYSKGNAITKAAEGEPIIFKWDGYGDYNVADIEKTYARNINNYINSLDLDEEDKKKVRDESFRLLQGMKSGLLTSRDASGKWTNVPVGYESTGINEQKRKFLKGKQYIKDDDFYRNNAYSVLDKALQDTNIYTPPKAQPSKFDTKFENYLTKYYFRDLPFNKALWDFNTSRTNIGARLADWRKEVEASDLDDKTKADLLNRIDVGIAGIQSATTDDDFAALARIGFDARKWIDPNYIAETSTSTEQPLTEEQKKQQETVENFKNYLETNRNSGDSYYFSKQLLKPDFNLSGYKDIIDYSNKNPINWAEWTSTSNPQLFSNNFWAFFNEDLIKDLENQGFYENGYYYIPQSVNENEGSIFRFNRNTNNIEKVPLSSFKKGVKKLEYLFGMSAGIKKPWEYKEGGIIKAQQGWYVDNTTNLKSKRLEELKSKEEASKQQNRQQTKQSTGFENSNEPFKWDKETKLRFSSLIADLASLGLSYSGVGSIGSAAAGVTATALNQAADQAAGKGFGEALGDNLISYGLDAISVIPFAKSLKIPRVLANAAKLAPMVITGLGAINGGEEYLKSWNKLTKGESLNMQDYRNMLESVQLLVSGKAASRNIKKLDRDLQASISGTHQRIRTNQGFKQLTNEQISEIRNAANYEDANKILQKYVPGASLPKEYKAWGLGKETGKAVVDTRNSYQPRSYTRTTASGMEYNETPTWSSKLLAGAQWNNPIYNLGPKIRTGYDWVAHPQMSWRRYQSSKSTNTTPNEPNASNNSTATSTKKTTNTKKTSNSKRSTKKASEKSYDFVKVGNSTYFRDSDGKLKSLTKNDNGTYTMGSTGKTFKVRGKRAVLVEKEGGILKAQQGNVLKYQNPSGAIRGVTYNTNTNWRDNVFNNFQEDLIEGLLSGRYTYQEVNALQKQYSPLWHKYRNNLTSPTYDKAVLDYQTAFNNFGQGMGNNLGIAGAIRANRYNYLSNNPNSGDNASTGWTAEGRYAGQTNDRTLLGRKGDFTPEQLAAMNQRLATKGLEIFTDTDDVNYIREIPNTTLDTSGLDQEVADVNKNIPSPADVLKSNLSGSPAGVDEPAPTTPKQLDWGNLLGTGRLIGTIATNNAIARGLKNSLSPLLLDPLQLRRQVVGDLATRNYMERLGAEANRLGARPITSDANLQLAQQLEYNNRANDYRTRGWLADKQAIDKTTAEAQKVADFNAEQRNTVANRNRAAMLGIRQAKANIEAQRKSANWQQAVAPWLMSMEMKFAENKKLNDQLNYQENQYTLGSQYDNAARQAQDNLNAAKANYLAIDGNNEAGWLTSPEYTAARKTYEQDLANATNAYQTGMLNARRKSLRYNPFLFVYKSGGRLSYKEKALLERAKDFNKSLLEDRKTFHKIIMESQKENNKLITSLSGLTKELIIKSMTYAD